MDISFIFIYFALNCSYFPKGGGYCKVSIQPINHFKCVELNDFGDIKSYFGWSFVAGTLPIKVKR